MTLKPLRGRVLVAENPVPAMSGGVAVDCGPWSPFLDYVVVRAPDGADYGAGDRVVVRFTESGRKVSVGGLAYREIDAGDVLAVVED